MAAYNLGAIASKQHLQTLLQAAEKAEKAGNLEEAGKHWEEAGKQYRKLAEGELNQLEYARLLKKAKVCEARALKPELENNADDRTDRNGFEARADEWIFKSNVSFDDIAGMSEIKKQLKYALGLQLARIPESVSCLELPTRIFLSGQPGCGKTLLAAACANSLNAGFFNVPIPELVSKYVGESSKMISALYRRARDIADEGVAVVFIDEIDGLIVNRDTGSANHEKQVLNTFLAELDGLAQKSSRSSVITIVATNKPDSLDDAFLSRMDLKFIIELPDEEARREIFRIHIEKRGFELEEKSICYSDLADWTHGQSGRDIQSLCKHVLLNVLAEENAEIPNLVDTGRIKEYTLRIRKFTGKDFQKALGSFKGSRRVRVA